MVKIRTDQDLDVILLVGDIVSNCNSGRQLTLAHLDRRKPAWLPDFYFGGDVIFLEDCLRAALRPISARASVHKELFWKWGNQFSKVRLPWIFFPFSDLMHSRIVDVWRHFGLASREVWESIIWRGEPMSVIESSLLFSRETKSNSGPTDPDFQLYGFESVARVFVREIIKPFLTAGIRTRQRR